MSKIKVGKKTFLDPRDPKGVVVGNLRKTLIKDYLVEEKGNLPLEVGDRVIYLGVRKESFNKVGTIVGKRDLGGFYILLEKEGRKFSSTPGALRYISSKKVEEKKEEEKKEE